MRKGDSYILSTKVEVPCSTCGEIQIRDKAYERITCFDCRKKNQARQYQERKAQGIPRIRKVKPKQETLQEWLSSHNNSK